MAKLIYSAITSLDGFIEDGEGKFAFLAPDEEVSSFVNELERPVGTYLYGRRMYETMVYWETASSLPDQSPSEQDFTQLWLAANKVVYSRTLERVSSAKTRLEREFDPRAIQAMKDAEELDISVGGSNLASQAFAAGLVDECQLYLAPIIVGGGTQGLPSGVRLSLELVDERRFRSGFVYLHHRVLPSTQRTNDERSSVGRASV
ncbi:MAG TPA: dihydrofolate reductase family protein [Acidimicrobiales bacterium]|nr:dihydrofolate reductase family protein [Acidimicrobiales bacterium]